MEIAIEPLPERLILHSRELEIYDIILSINDLEIENFSCQTFAENDYLILSKSEAGDQLGQPLQFLLGDQVTITFYYQGFLLNKTVGVYKSFYTDPEIDQKIPVIATQHEPTYSRRTFPNFDEPHLKAEHILSLAYIKNQGFFGISNMPVEKVQDLSQSEFLDLRDRFFTSSNLDYANYERAVFQKTPKMSTYLATWIVCDFDYIEETSISGIPLRVYLTRHQNKLNQGEWGLQNLKHSFDYFENDLFKIPYPLPKMDMIAIPNFNTGAMENWGAVTYRENALLYQANVSSVHNKERVAQVVSHELAHMWYGNLVTMVDWDNIWLNEGFASYFQWLGVINAVDRIYTPTEAQGWGGNNKNLNNIFSALDNDALATGFPIIYKKIQHKNDITGVFNIIPYRKGATMIWSLVQVMGFDNFFEGVRNYLLDNAYGNVVSEDLLRIFLGC